MEEKYNYFIAYCYKKTGLTTGYAYCHVTRDSEIKTIDDINVIASGISEKFDMGTVVILNYILISKPEQENAGCELCINAAYTERPFTVTKPEWNKSRQVQFHYCPVCGRMLPMSDGSRQ